MAYVNYDKAQGVVVPANVNSSTTQVTVQTNDHPLLRTIYIDISGTLANLNIIDNEDLIDPKSSFKYHDHTSGELNLFAGNCTILRQTRNLRVDNSSSKLSPVPGSTSCQIFPG